MSGPQQRTPPNDLAALAELPRRASAPRVALQRCVALLPRGRARIARLLAGRFKEPFLARVPPFHLDIHLIIDPEDSFQLEIWLGAYQPHVASFLVNTVRPGDVVLCAGLHVGYVAAIARRLAGPSGLVLTAEPDPVALAWARRNLSLSDPGRDAPIEVLEGGLSDVDCEMELFRSSVIGHSSFASPHHLSGMERAVLRSGDEWLGAIAVRRFDVAVLDVEGWEMRVLRGLSQTIARSSCLVALVECSDWALGDAGASPAELIDYFRTRDFEVRWAATHDRSLPHGVWGPKVESGIAGGATDILCIGPEARQDLPRHQARTGRRSSSAILPDDVHPSA